MGTATGGMGAAGTGVEALTGSDEIASGLAGDDDDKGFAGREGCKGELTVVSGRGVGVARTGSEEASGGFGVASTGCGAGAGSASRAWALAAACALACSFAACCLASVFLRISIL